MRIEDRTIDYVAALAKLELTEEGTFTREKARADLESILAYMETMNGLDTEGIEPMPHVLPLCNVFREDEPAQGEAWTGERRMQEREALLANAPLQKEGCFVVPKTVE